MEKTIEKENMVLFTEIKNDVKEKDDPEIELEYLQERLIYLFGKVNIKKSPFYKYSENKIERDKSISIRSIRARIKEIQDIIKYNEATEIKQAKYSDLLIEGIEVLKEVTDVYVVFSKEQKIEFTVQGVFIHLTQDQKKAFEFTRDSLNAVRKLNGIKNCKQKPCDLDTLICYIQTVQKSLESELQARKKRLSELDSKKDSIKRIQQFNRKSK